MQPISQNAQMGMPSGIYQQQNLEDNGQVPQQQNGLQIIVNLQPQPQAFYPNNQFFVDPSVQAGTEFPQIYQPVPMSDPKQQSGTIYPFNERATSGKEDDQPEQQVHLPAWKTNPPKKKAGEPVFHPWRGHPSRYGCCKMDKEKIETFLCLLLGFFMIANLSIIIALLVYHFGNKDVTLTSVGEALVYIGENLSADPILEIRVKDDTGSCDSGYDAMLLGTWPGTARGCDCPITGLKKETCDKKGQYPTDSLCTDVYATSPVDMIDWGGSYWCVKKAELGTQYTKSVECGSEFRECSPGICVLSTLNCPVTKVEIQSSGTYKLRVGTNRYVVTTSTSGESPVVDLIITPNDIPCFSKDRYAAGPTNPYKLLNENEEGCSNYGTDQYSFQIDKMTQDKLFGQNDFPNEVMDLPDYDDIYENTYSVLSYRQRINVAKNDFCLDIDIDLLEKSSYAAEKLNKFMSGTSIAAMIIHGLLVLLVGFFMGTMKNHGNSWKEILKGEGETQGWSLLCTRLGVIEYIDLIVMFATAKHYRGIMATTEQYFGQLISMNCFLDSQPQEAVNDYQVAVDVVAGNLQKYSLALFLITTLTVIPSFYLVWKHNNRN